MKWRWTPGPEAGQTDTDALDQLIGWQVTIGGVRYELMTFSKEQRAPALQDMASNGGPAHYVEATRYPAELTLLLREVKS